MISCYLGAILLYLTKYILLRGPNTARDQSGIGGLGKYNHLHQHNIKIGLLRLIYLFYYYCCYYLVDYVLPFLCIAGRISYLEQPIISPKIIVGVANRPGGVVSYIVRFLVVLFCPIMIQRYPCLL